MGSPKEQSSVTEVLSVKLRSTEKQPHLVQIQGTEPQPYFVYDKVMFRSSCPNGAFYGVWFLIWDCLRLGGFLLFQLMRTTTTPSMMQVLPWPG